mmetsp:Transcript_33193/g.91490  ORF Transcript_33193/g.91490 Transcript_33193/m.91490 type:complete len:148 (+) Transcript_33193:1517-1960(+)
MPKTLNVTTIVVHLFVVACDKAYARLPGFGSTSASSVPCWSAAFEIFLPRQPQPHPRRPKKLGNASKSTGVRVKFTKMAKKIAKTTPNDKDRKNATGNAQSAMKQNMSVPPDPSTVCPADIKDASTACWYSVPIFSSSTKRVNMNKL